MKASKSRARTAVLSLWAAFVGSACSLLAPTDDELKAGAGREGGGRAGEPSGGTAGTASGGASGVGGSVAGGGSGGRSGSGGGAAGAGGGGCLQELLVNGDFDDGPSGWTEESTDGTPLLIHRANTRLIDQGVDAYSPDYLAWLGSPDHEERLWRSIELPDGTVTVGVAGFYRINTDEPNDVLVDEAYVELVQGTTAFALGHFSNQDAIGQWTAFEGGIDADVFGEGPVTFQLRSHIDEGVDTAFFFDSISVRAELENCR